MNSNDVAFITTYYEVLLCIELVNDTTTIKTLNLICDLYTEIECSMLNKRHSLALVYHDMDDALGGCY